MQTVGSQTDVTELIELRQVQQSLTDVREELTTVNAELGHAEQRLRNEVREEYDERMRTFERRTKEKVSYLKRRQEASVGAMRKALNASLVQAKVMQESELRIEYEQHAARCAEEARALRTQLEQQELRLAAREQENHDLREQMDKRGAAGGGPPPPRRSMAAAEESADGRVSQLEAQLASRDATIKALREQLAKLQAAPAAEVPPPSRGGTKSPSSSKAKGKG